MWSGGRNKFRIIWWWKHQQLATRAIFKVFVRCESFGSQPINADKRDAATSKLVSSLLLFWFWWWKVWILTLLETKSFQKSCATLCSSTDLTILNHADYDWKGLSSFINRKSLTPFWLIRRFWRRLWLMVRMLRIFSSPLKLTELLSSSRKN